MRMKSFRRAELTSVYGSLVSVGSSASGMNGGEPAVVQKVPGVGKVSPKANWTSKSASAPAALKVWLFVPPELSQALSERAWHPRENYFSITIDGNDFERRVQSVWPLVGVKQL